MKSRLRSLTVIAAALLAWTTMTPSFADDGEMVRKSMSREAQPSVEGYVDEAEHPFIGMMKFYVPAQAANGTVAPVDYLNVDEVLVSTRQYAKPLVGVYINGPFIGVEEAGGFVGHGKREGFFAVSLDDGLTRKKTDLPQSADLESSDVVSTDIPLFSDTDCSYPGDVINVLHTIMGNKVLVAWPSRFCNSGHGRFHPAPRQRAPALRPAGRGGRRSGCRSGRALCCPDWPGDHLRRHCFHRQRRQYRQLPVEFR